MHILACEGLLHIQFHGRMMVVEIVLFLVTIISNSMPIRDGSSRHQ